MTDTYIANAMTSIDSLMIYPVEDAYEIFPARSFPSLTFFEGHVNIVTSTAYINELRQLERSGLLSRLYRVNEDIGNAEFLADFPVHFILPGVYRQVNK